MKEDQLFYPSLIAELFDYYNIDGAQSLLFTREDTQKVIMTPYIFNHCNILQVLAQNTELYF